MLPLFHRHWREGSPRPRDIIFRISTVFPLFRCHWLSYRKARIVSHVALQKYHCHKLLNSRWQERLKQFKPMSSILTFLRASLCNIILLVLYTTPNELHRIWVPWRLIKPSSVGVRCSSVSSSSVRATSACCFDPTSTSEEAFFHRCIRARLRRSVVNELVRLFLHCSGSLISAHTQPRLNICRDDCTGNPRLYADLSK